MKDSPMKSVDGRLLIHDVEQVSSFVDNMVSYRVNVNSANWNLIRKSLAKVGIPAYFAAIVDSYITETRLWYDTDDGPQEYLFSRVFRVAQAH